MTLVQLLMVVSTVLERNPELNFNGTVDLDEVSAETGV